MGIGIIALGLWMLYGLDFRINEIQVFPPIISYIVVLLGLVISYKKTNEQVFKYALLFPVGNIVLCFFETKSVVLSTLISLALLYPLYLMLLTIYNIATDYPKKEKYRMYYMGWIIIQIIMLVLMSFGNDAPLMILNCLLWIEVLLAVLVIYHLVKINKYISDEYEDISYHMPTYNKKHYIIMLLLSVLSICSIVLIEKPYLETTKEEIVYQENKFFKVDHEDFKIPPFGYTKETTTSLLSGGWSSSFFGLKLYIKDELLENLDYVNCLVTYNGKVVYHLQGKASLYENRYGDFYYTEYDIYENYKEISVDGEDRFNDDVLEKYNTNDSFKISINLYAKNKEVIYSNIADIVPVTPTTYRYSDDRISIENLQYDSNGLVSVPKVRIKDPNNELTHVIIYYPHDGEGENVLLYIYNGWDGDGVFDLDTVRHFIYDRVDEFKSILIEYRNGETIVDSRLCELEVVP